MGGSVNFNRAQDAGSYYVAQRDIVHDRAAKELRRVRKETSAIGSRQERIDWFVRNREATLGLMDDERLALREERAKRLLPRNEKCESDEIAGKDT
jgi:hypothetical protein